MGYSKLVDVVSVLVPFFAQGFKKDLVKSNHSNCFLQVQLTVSQCLQVHKENALTEKSTYKGKCSLGDEHCIVKRKTLS